MEPAAVVPDVDEIRSRVREIICQVTGIRDEELDDAVELVADLDFDSLSMMEIAVDIDYAYRLQLPEERMQAIRSVREAVELVRRELEARAAA